MAIPTVSVIMAVYNTEQYVRSAAESILRQTYTDFEYIIVDDGSTDGTPAILNQLASQDERIVLVRQPRNQGYTRALNIGLTKARGPLLARQDADDLSRPERLRQEVDFLSTHSTVGLVSGQVEAIGPAGDRLPVSIF